MTTDLSKPLQAGLGDDRAPEPRFMALMQKSHFAE